VTVGVGVKAGRAGRRRRRAGGRGALTLLDVLVMAVLLGILLVAASSDFPRLAGRSIGGKVAPASPNATDRTSG
jgi:hypothetical protein